MQRMTLCFLLRDGEVCLGMKKKGFGKGYWNGAGGKIENEETFHDCAVREVEEELGVQVRINDLEHVAQIRFIEPNGVYPEIFAHVYIARNWEGEPIETDELRPKWFSHDKLPFDSMWADDPHWLPHVLEGKKIKAVFHLDKGGKQLVSHEVEILD